MILWADVTVPAELPEVRDEISYQRRTSYSPAMLRITVDQVLDAADSCVKATV